MMSQLLTSVKEAQQQVICLHVPALLKMSARLRIHCLSLALAVHTFILWKVAEAGLEITPSIVPLNRHSDLTTTTFTCAAVPPNKIPRQQTVVWMKDGEVIVTLGTKKYHHYRRRKELEIRSLNETDAGVYECAIGQNSTERGRAEIVFSPDILSAPIRQEIVRDSPSERVECEVTGGRRVVEWWKNQLFIASSDPNLNSTDTRYSVTDSGSLLISPVIRGDNGQYTCIVKNLAGRVEKHIRVKLINMVPTPPTTTKPYKPLPLPRNLSHCVEYTDVRFGGALPYVNTSVSSPTSDLTIVPHDCVQTRVGYRIVLSCVSKQDHAIHWTKDGESVLSNSTNAHYVQFSNGSLLITTVQVSDAGLYTCTATSTHGQATTEVKLEVRSEVEQCGIKGPPRESNNTERSKRIVRGYAVSGIDEWPWQVLIEYKEDLMTSLLPTAFCGGVLVRSDWIMTAAHCLINRNGQPRPIDSLIVRAGVFNRTHGMEEHQQLLQVKRYIIHPSFDMRIGHDVALIQLSRPVLSSPHVSSICLPPLVQDLPVGTVCTVTGWGSLEHGVDDYPELLHQGKVPLVSQSDCTSRDSYARLVTENMLCAGWKEGGTDACKNDSGGPLICEIPENEGRWALYGIVIYGEGCGAPQKYGVYARVTKYLSWMNNIMNSS